MIIPNSYARVVLIMKRMRIPHPLLQDVFNAADTLREEKRDALPMEEQRSAMLLAPSHSGKSTAIKMYIEQIVVPQCIERGFFPANENHVEIALKQKLVIHVTLSPDASVGSLLTDILRVLGDPRPEKGTIPERRLRVFTLIENLGVELLVIDEIQHIGSKTSASTPEKRETATYVENNLKMLMIGAFPRTGVPILFVGRPEARSKVSSDEQNEFRLEDEIAFGPLDETIDEHFDIFVDYCGRLSLRLLDDGILDHEVDLIGGTRVAQLMNVSGGRLGLVSVFIRWALKIAMAENADTITDRHFYLATEKFMRKKLASCRVNPFPRPEPALLRA